MLMGPVRRNAYSSGDAHASPEAARDDIQRAHAVHLEYRPDLQMVLEIGADTAKVVQHFDAVLAQQRLRGQGRRAAAGAVCQWSPDARMTSRAARTVTRSPPRLNSAPVQRKRRSHPA
jgi:hypothetical protein